MDINYIILIICPAFCLFMFFYFNWYIKKRTSSAGILPEYRNEIYKLIADIDAATDRDSLLVEERIKQLREILDDTEKRISEYKQELDSRPVLISLAEKLPAEVDPQPEKKHTPDTVYTNLGRGIRAALKTEVDNAPVLNTHVPQLSVVRPNVVFQSPPVREEPPLPRPQSKRQIRAHIDILANEGLPPEEIASRLDISFAEVDLAMNLRRAKINEK